MGRGDDEGEGMLAWVRRRPVAVLLGTALLLLVGPGCHLIFPFSSEETGAPFSCAVQVWQCGMKADPVTLSKAPGAAPGAGTPYVVVNGLNSDKGLSYHPYHNSPLIFKAVSPLVRGATLLQTGAGDWKATAQEFLTVTVLSNVEALYVAYDSRATPPSWLTGSDPHGHTYSRQSASLVLSAKDQATGQDLRLDLWKMNEAPGSTPVVIPGNSYGSPGFQNISGNPLMYVVLIQPGSVPDCTNGTRLADHTFTGCAEDDQAQAALADCRAKNPNLVCQAPSCQAQGDTCRLEQGLRSYQAGSLVEFFAQPQVIQGISVAASRAEVTVGDSSSSSPVSGTLHFSYEGDLQRLTVNELVLGAGTVSTDAGQFQNTVLSLWDTASADCVGGPPPFGQPCNGYEIAVGGLQVSVASRLDGQDALWNGENNQTVTVNINQAARTFGFSGTVLVSVDTNQGPVDLTAGLDLHGFIADVVPQAVAGEESQLEAECVEDRNDEPLLLSAAGSFQVYASSPQNLPRYEWWEDFGLVTQHEWGTAKNVTIPRGALAFGSHEITLLVGDQSGLLDTATVEAAVVDTVPPVFSSLPADITTDIYPAGTESVQVELGVYSARDACNPYVEVTNNAPEGGWFTPGTHTVTWRADDLRGNVTEVTQQVNVRVLGQRFPWQWVLVGVAGILILGGAAWLLARRGKAPAQRSSSEATLPPPPPTAGSRAPVWIAAGAGIMVVAAGTVAAFLLLGRDNGEPAAGSTTTGQVTTTGQTPTTSPGTGSSEGTTTSPEETTSTGAETTTTSPEETTSSMAETTTSLAETTSSSAPTTIPGPTLNPDGPATYGEVKLVSGFLTDPAPYPITAGGPIDLTAALPGQGCLGFAAANPDLRFQWEGEGGLLRFYYFPAGDPDSPPPDTTLTIRDPAGGWHCNDDSYGTPHPTVDINPSQRGYYQIWVGTYQPDQNPTGTLNITELDTNHP